jgi:hypothetical protein
MAHATIIHACRLLGSDVEAEENEGAKEMWRQKKSEPDLGRWAREGKWA